MTRPRCILAALLALLFVQVVRADVGGMADMAAIQAMLCEMSRATLAGDVPGYLACVDQTDHLFMQEQSMWAGDLRRTRPASFSLIPAAEPAGALAPDADVASLDLVMTWSLPSGTDGSHGPEREVKFPAEFRRDAPGSRWLYAGEAWSVLESPVRDERGRDIPAHRRARVKFLPGYEDAAKKILEVFPGTRARVHDEFDTRIDRVQEVKLYPSVRHLQASIYLSYTDVLSGWNEPGEAIKLFVPPGVQQPRLRTLLSHEYSHVVTFELGPNATDMPWWILEGVAELLPEKLAVEARSAGRGRTRHRVIGWARDGRLAAWDDLTDFRSVAPALQNHVYRQGNHMLMFVGETFGRPARDHWLRLLSQGVCLDEATAGSLGLTFGELDARWRAAVAKSVSDEDADRAAP